MITVNILSEERNILHLSSEYLDTFVSKLPDLIQDGVDWSGSLSSSGEWYYAEGTHVVTSSHHTDEGAVVTSLLSDW